jgi:hypothetical protein
MMDDFRCASSRVDQGAIVGIVVCSDLDPHVGHLEWTPVRSPWVSAHGRPDAPIGDVVRILLDGNFAASPSSPATRSRDDHTARSVWPSRTA